MSVVTASQPFAEEWETLSLALNTQEIQKMFSVYAESMAPTYIKMFGVPIPNFLDILVEYIFKELTSAQNPVLIDALRMTQFELEGIEEDDGIKGIEAIDELFEDDGHGLTDHADIIMQAVMAECVSAMKETACATPGLSCVEAQVSVVSASTLTADMTDRVSCAAKPAPSFVGCIPTGHTASVKEGAGAEGTPASGVVGCAGAAAAAATTPMIWGDVEVETAAALKIASLPLTGSFTPAQEELYKSLNWKGEDSKMAYLIRVLLHHVHVGGAASATPMHTPEDFVAGASKDDCLKIVRDALHLDAAPYSGGDMAGHFMGKFSLKSILSSHLATVLSEHHVAKYFVEDPSHKEELLRLTTIFVNTNFIRPVVVLCLQKASIEVTPVRDSDRSATLCCWLLPASKAAIFPTKGSGGARAAPAAAYRAPASGGSGAGSGAPGGPNKYERAAAARASAAAAASSVSGGGKKVVDKREHKCGAACKGGCIAAFVKEE
jgi:hypothetical protein